MTLETLRAWMPIAAVVIALIALLTSRAQGKSSANVTQIAALESRIVALEAKLSECEKERNQVVRENQELMKRFLLGNGKQGGGP